MGEHASCILADERGRVVKLEVTVLGCGTSGGVPQLVSGYGACDEFEVRNRRRRSSLLLRHGEETILVDTSPDMHDQLWGERVKRLDGVIYTHGHADHTNGLDDLRWFCASRGRALSVYGSEETLKDLRVRFDYAFEGDLLRAGEEGDVDERAGRFGSGPVLRGFCVEEGYDYEIGGMEVMFMRQDHGFSETLGLRVGDFAYSTDVVRLSEENYEGLRGVKTWIVDCLRFRSHPTHMNYEEALCAIERVGVERAYFTHMNNDMDYGTLCRMLPCHVRPAYDGLKIEV